MRCARSGGTEEACASYAAALALEPHRADALNNLGLALVALGQHREALAKFDAALAIDPNDIGALHNRANALFELGSFEEALAPCDAVLTGNPAHIDALNTRGVVLAKLRRFEEALASYDAALARGAGSRRHPDQSRHRAFGARPLRRGAGELRRRARAPILKTSPP